MDVWLVDLLEMESLLPVFGSGQQIHVLPRILDRIRMAAIIRVPNTVMQADSIVI